MTYDSVERNNTVYGVDTQFRRLGFDLGEYPTYKMIQGDSSSVGKAWDTEEYGTVKLLFVDSIHVAAQVASELYHWWDHMEEDGYIVFHDTNWSAGMHDLTWVPEVKEKGIQWDRPEVAVVASLASLNCLRSMVTKDSPTKMTTSLCFIVLNPGD